MRWYQDTTPRYVLRIYECGWVGVYVREGCVMWLNGMWDVAEPNTLLAYLLRRQSHRGTSVRPLCGFVA